MTPTDRRPADSFAYSRRSILTGVTTLGATVIAVPVVRAVPASQPEELADEEPAGEEPAAEEPAEYSSYQTVTDDTGTISVQVPTEWTEAMTLGSPDTELSLVLSPELSTFATSFETAESQIVTPGAVVVYMPETTTDPAALSKEIEDYPLNCTKIDSTEYANQNGLDGVVTIHGNCGGADDLVIKFVASPESGTGTVAAAFAITDDRDVAAAVTFLETLTVTPQVAEPEEEPEAEEQPIPEEQPAEATEPEEESDPESPLDGVL
ncbi:hypothetical protein [Haloarchaeobius sp. DT45]|uniref:hypothetical protein n=1 Tax=Haloarchaeobius sp. DT45 TaxID=3446116 RepID=UPI003F6C2B43